MPEGRADSGELGSQRQPDYLTGYEIGAHAAGILVVWLGTTIIFWVGYVGTDDFFYARYAFLFHRPPTNWWEFRIPAVLAIRASFAALGPSEFAAALPTLLSSLVILLSVAWQAEWFKRPTWEATLALLIACTLPLDVGFRSVPYAGFIAGALLISGSVCIIRGRIPVMFVGALLLGLGFLTHEASVYYVAIFCFTLLWFACKRFWWVVVLCVAVSGTLALVEGVTYRLVLGDFFARFRTAAGATATLVAGTDPDTGISGIGFFLWPIQNLVLGKGFGIDLVLLIVAAVVAWRHLDQGQRILVSSAVGLYVWLGYGTQLPWAYKPFYRQLHYYFPVTLGLASVLPFAIRRAMEPRVRLGRTIVIAAVLVHILLLAAGGRWGQNVDVSRRLLDYAHGHPGERFVTDVNTMNQMYVLGGFRMPENVICLNGAAVQRHLLLNKEPPGAPRFAFPDLLADGILVNMEGGHDRTFEPEFQNFLVTHPGHQVQVAPPRFRIAFLPLLLFMQPKDVMLRSLGGVRVYLD